VSPYLYCCFDAGTSTHTKPRVVRQALQFIARTKLKSERRVSQDVPEASHGSDNEHEGGPFETET